MKRPSNLIFTFIFALAGVFIAYALGRIIVRAISPPEIEIEDDYKSQLYIPHRDPFEQAISPHSQSSALPRLS